MTQTRKFKRINLLGLDFYVDWIEETGQFISIKEVHSGRIFVYKGLINSEGKSVEGMFREAVGAFLPVEEKEEEVKEEVAPAALETEQPKEELNDKKTKGRNRKVQK